MTGTGSHAAQAYLYNELHRQAAMLAYLDVIQYMSIFCACMIPLLFFIPRPPKHCQSLRRSLELKHEFKVHERRFTIGYASHFAITALCVEPLCACLGVKRVEADSL